LRLAAKDTFQELDAYQIFINSFGGNEGGFKEKIFSDAPSVLELSEDILKPNKKKCQGNLCFLAGNVPFISERKGPQNQILDNEQVV